jgi:hypothetical protein
VIIRAAHVEGIRAFEPKHDPILIVDAHCMETSEVTGERVPSISGRDLQVVEPGYHVDLIQLPPDDGPQLARDAPSRLAIDTVPDITRGVVSQRPDHGIAF